MKEDSNKLKEYLVKNIRGDYVTTDHHSGFQVGDLIEIPDGAEICYFFSRDDLRAFEGKFTFYKNGITEIYNGEEDGWIVTDPSCYDFILNKGNLVWKCDKLQETVDKYNATDHGEDFYKFDLLGDSVKPVKSDGGSSSYYFTTLPEHLIKDIVERGGIEIKDIVRYCFDNDADCKDIIKALKRIRENLKGGGKEGVDSIYDANKICFFAEELRSSLKVPINK